MINSKGEDTSILFGFTKTLLELINREKPSHLAVVFDPPGKTFRDDLFPQYKANRSETPELIKNCLTPLSELVSTLNIPVFTIPRFEADDVIGTLSKIAEKSGFSVYMVTPDKDYGQLVSEKIFQYKPSKGDNEIEILGAKEICSNYGIDSPEQVSQILAIWGDASDNVPGVKGIGEVGSKKLIAKYGSVKNIYNNLQELPIKQQDAFLAAKDYIDLSLKLVTIETSVPVDFNEDNLRLQTPNFNQLKKLFAHYEFNSLQRILKESESVFDLTDTNSDYENLNIQDVKKPSYEVLSPENLFIATMASKKIGVKIIENSCYISAGRLVSKIDLQNLNLFSDILENENIAKIGIELKQFILYFHKRGFELKGELIDLEVMHYLISPERSHKISYLAKGYLDLDIEAVQQSVKQPKLFEEMNIEVDDSSYYSEVAVYFDLEKKLHEDLEKNGAIDLYTQIEQPLISVLADLEIQGFKIDNKHLQQYGNLLLEEMNKSESRIKSLADEPDLNVASPKQLGVVLFDKLKITEKAKVTANKSYSTDEETLLKLWDKHPIISEILEYRNIRKLISTYIEPLIQISDPKTGKIHTTFNQTLTSTGRLSSIKPNLQNIPIRSERGKEIRKAFVPSMEDGLILSADYSQIELRLMAHMSGDNDFIEAFNLDKDVHTATAAKIFKVAESDVTKDQRGKAKTANFGIIYGISAFGLSQRLAISQSESKKLIEDYFLNYPKVKFYMTTSILNAREKGYAETLFGRRRYLPDINSKNNVVRSVAERNAINAPIQGSAADIIKIAMVRIFNRLEKEGLKSKMILQVHDELLFDTNIHEAEMLKNIVKYEMENVTKLSVPITVESSYGHNWLEAH